MRITIPFRKKVVVIKTFTSTIHRTNNCLRQRYLQVHIYTLNKTLTKYYSQSLPINRRTIFPRIVLGRYINRINIPVTKWYRVRRCRWCNPRIDNPKSHKKFLNFVAILDLRKILLKK